MRQQHQPGIPHYYHHQEKLTHTHTHTHTLALACTPLLHRTRFLCASFPARVGERSVSNRTHAPLPPPSTPPYPNPPHPAVCSVSKTSFLLVCAFVSSCPFKRLSLTARLWDWAGIVWMKCAVRSLWFESNDVLLLDVHTRTRTHLVVVVVVAVKVLYCYFLFVWLKCVVHSWWFDQMIS